MKKINIDSWKEFKVGDLFEIRPTKNYNLINSKLFETQGETPVVVNSSYNNGIGGYVNLDPTESGGIITFSDTTSSSAIFYQEKDFIGYSHVQGMYPYDNKWTKNSMLFFLTAFKKAAHLLGFDYVNKFTREIAKEIVVKLPVINNELDYKGMEKYIESSLISIENYLGSLGKIDNFRKNSISKDGWKKFKIGDIFEVSRPSARSQSKYDDGEVPFVASGNYNNGVLRKCRPLDEEILDKGNCITVSPVDGSSFYQDVDFLGRGGAGSSIIILRNKTMNKYSGLFLCTIISKVCSKYSYNDMGNKDSIKEEYIKLPVDKNGNPDWIYMAEYIKKMFNIYKYDIISK